MSFFTSDRERRLWIWLLVALVAIYSTLVLARTLADMLGDYGFGVGLFMLGCLMVLAAVLTQGLSRRPAVAEVGIAIGIAAAYLFVFVRMSIVTERSHIIEYGVVAIIIFEILQERVKQGRRISVPALLAILLTTLVGAIDECIQLFIPSRIFDPIDIFFNFIAAVMAVTASVALAWGRRKWGPSG
ncbi:MAG: VanZ family protein [Cyclobacteriaceae bacterium]|nr:VanZ family protein [Cyclobacteriaceae bacterium]